MKPTTHCPDGYATCAVHNIRDCDAGGRCRKHLQPPPAPTPEEAAVERFAAEIGRMLTEDATRIRSAAALDTEGNDHG